MLSPWTILHIRVSSEAVFPLLTSMGLGVSPTGTGGAAMFSASGCSYATAVFINAAMTVKAVFLIRIQITNN